MPSRRREFLGSAAAAALAAGCQSSDPAPAANAQAAAVAAYARLGVKPVVNAVGTVTILGGSIMPPEVVEAMNAAAQLFVPMIELQEKAGAHLAKIIGVPAAMVACGAASAIAVGTAACLTRGDAARLRALPDTSGMPNEIVQQRTHRSGYEAQMLLNGAKIVWVETRAEMERALNERTAMAFFLNKAEPDGEIKRTEFIELCKSRGVPTLNDAAADVPPVGRLRAYVDEGFDLVVFSGGKGLLGPQSSGLLLGREDLIAAGRQTISPHGGIGRGMKVGKEEMLGLVAAVERYLRIDHAAERAVLDGRAERVLARLAGVGAVKAELLVPEFHNNVPHVVVRWDENEAGLTAEQAVERLKAGDPPVWISRTGPGELRASMWMLRDGEDAIVAERVAGLFG